MNSLRNIKKIPLEVGKLLANNKKFCGFLVDDSKSPQSIQMSYEDLLNQHYIVIYPPNDDGEMKEYTRNTYAAILIDTIDMDDIDNNARVTGHIFLTTTRDHIVLSENRNRLLELCDEVVSTLNDVKITSASKIYISSIVFLMMDVEKPCYRISFELSDQQVERAEI